jgi:hypothetical protein
VRSYGQATDEAIADLKDTWLLLEKLRSSPTVVWGRYWSRLLFKDWLVYSEPVQLFEAADWQKDDELGIAYVKALFGSGILNSLGREKVFDSLRDNALRGARKRQRAPHRLQALTLAAIRKHYPNADHVEIEPMDVDTLGAHVHVRPQAFAGDLGCPKSHGTLALDPSVSETLPWSGRFLPLRSIYDNAVARRSRSSELHVAASPEFDPPARLAYPPTRKAAVCDS